MSVFMYPVGTRVIFPSEAKFKEAIAPLTLDEILAQVSKAVAPISLNFQFDGSLNPTKVVPLRNLGVKNLLKIELHKANYLAVYYPESPRVPHQLAIAFHRDIKGISQLTEEENGELFATIKKVAEIYKTLSIQGFVIAMYDTPQQGHEGRFVVELIPHIPGFQKVISVLDKVDCNRHVLFRSANLSPVIYKVDKEHGAFWETAFQKELPPLIAADTKIEFPFTRHIAHQAEAEKVLLKWLLEILEDNGGKIEELESDLTMTGEVPQTVTSTKSERCFFCDEGVIGRQLVYSYKDTFVFYNIRKGQKPGSCFLILPKGHTEKVYGLTPSEIQQISAVRKKLVEVLKEVHPESSIVTYTQDHPSVGQSIFHTHEQVIVFDPKTIAFSWILQSFHPPSNVSDEEMLAVRKEFKERLDQKFIEQEVAIEAIV
jgi:diadenosine tetraphosphate (Ap4A) HIT family hydrolase